MGRTHNISAKPFPAYHNLSVYELLYRKQLWLHAQSRTVFFKRSNHEALSDDISEWDLEPYNGRLSPSSCQASTVSVARLQVSELDLWRPLRVTWYRLKALSTALIGMPPSTAEASTAIVTRLCLQKFQQCIRQLQGKDKIHIQTRLADLRLWSDSVGAAASEKASLDSRFQHRSENIIFIQQLLSMVAGLLQECLTVASDGLDVRDTIVNIDSTVDSLAFIGIQIRRSGRKSRLRKADGSFNRNRDRYRKLRTHLACILTVKPTKEGKPEDEGKEINSVDYFANMKLTPIQESLLRLI